MTAPNYEAVAHQLRLQRGQVQSRRSTRPTIERHADLTDTAVAIHEITATALARDSDARLLHQIDEALLAIALGQYGVCVECEQRIAPKRLEALPWALTCRSCAEAAETAAKELLQ
jgi:DnaK suppressor protein